jgi:tetratricopeptide (TPR) repeat protein
MRMKRAAFLGVAAMIAAFGVSGYTFDKHNEDPAMREAMQLGKEGKYAEAIEAAKKVVMQKASPEKKQPHIFLGLMYFKTRQYDDALNEFSYTLTLDKNSPMAYYFLGLTYEAKAVESSDRTAVKLLKRKALESWENYTKFSRLKKPVEAHHRNLGITVQKSRESADKHIMMLKEELGDEQN